jgi:hypothetical protein
MVRALIAGLALAAGMALSGALCGQEAPLSPGTVTPGSLTLEEVLRLSTSGVSDELIIASVKRNAKAFDLNADEIAALKKSGVSEIVIKYLLDPSLPYSPAAPGSPGAGTGEPAKKFPEDPMADKVPPDNGMYFVSRSQKFLALDLKPIVPQNQPGKFSKLMGGHIIGSAAESRAKIRAGKDPLVFYARLGTKIMIDDLVLLDVKPSKQNREIDFGTKAGTPVFPPKSVHQFESKEVGPGGLFRVTVPALNKGEYLFFILGSEEDKKGLLGKGYDFGVD